MKANLRIYGVKDSYIKYLSKYQEHLFWHEGGSSGRKYIGVVFEINKQKCQIRKNAEIVYNHKKRNGNLTPLAKRTNDFELLEKLSRDFW